MKKPLSITVAALAALPVSASSEVPVGPSLTIYNDNFGVVREGVALDLRGGVSEVSFSGVTSQMEPESVILRDRSGEVELRVVEQSYRADPVDRDGLLQMFEGETISFETVVGDRVTVVDGKIVRAPRSVMARGARRGTFEKTLEPLIEVDGLLLTRLPGEPRFPGLGDDSILEPTLSWKLFVPEEAALEAELSYLTRGISWRSDYNLVLPESGDAVSMTGWVSIENNTGKTFENARMKLIAGEVNKVSEPEVMMARSIQADLAYSPAPPPEVEGRDFDEFHIYSLPLVTTLRDRETKQVEFVRAERVETRRRFVFEGSGLRFYGRPNLSPDVGAGTRGDVAIYREFENTEENGLGVALPAGRIRFYRMDRDGQMEFTGENEIEHTPRNELIQVFLGNAFNIVGERKQKNFYKHPSRDMIQETFEIEIRNRGEEPVVVEVVEAMYRWSNWKITKNDREYVQLDAQTVRFDIEVGADGTESFSYTVEYNW